MVVEEKLNTCNDDYDLVVNAKSLSDTVGQIEDLVLSCQKLDSSLGLLLDEESALLFGQKLQQIFSKYLTPEQLGWLADSLENSDGNIS